MTFADNPRPYGTWTPKNAEALAKLAIALDRGAEICTAEFAEQLGVQQRTVQRHMVVMECVMPLEQVGQRGVAGEFRWRKMKL